MTIEKVVWISFLLLIAAVIGLVVSWQLGLVMVIVAVEVLITQKKPQLIYWFQVTSLFFGSLIAILVINLAWGQREWWVLTGLIPAILAGIPFLISLAIALISFSHNKHKRNGWLDHLRNKKGVMITTCVLSALLGAGLWIVGYFR